MIRLVYRNMVKKKQVRQDLVQGRGEEKDSENEDVTLLEKAGGLWTNRAFRLREERKLHWFIHSLTHSLQREPIIE